MAYLLYLLHLCLYGAKYISNLRGLRLRFRSKRLNKEITNFKRINCSFSRLIQQCAILLQTIHIFHFVCETTNPWTSDLKVQAFVSCIAGSSVWAK
jgi:hypothetical protein